MYNTALISISAWFGFGVIHSVLALNKVKSFLKLPPLPYRIFYNIIATFTLIGAILLSPPIMPIILQFFKISTMRQILFILILLLGIIIMLWGLSYWDLEAFLGFSPEEGTLETNGAFKFSRHPVYTGILVILLSLFMIEVTEATVSWFLGMGGYFIVGTIPEEYKLNAQFGKAYSNYQNEVGRFFPWKMSHLKNLRG